MTDNRSALREQVYGWLDACADPAGERVPHLWRAVVTDTESSSGFGPVCPEAGSHPLLDYGMGRDTDGVYDCCPHVVETFSVPLAAYLVELLNRDARSNPDRRRCPGQDVHYSHDWPYTAGPGQPQTETMHCPGLKTKENGS